MLLDVFWVARTVGTRFFPPATVLKVFTYCQHLFSESVRRSFRGLPRRASSTAAWGRDGGCASGRLQVDSLSDNGCRARNLKT